MGRGEDQGQNHSVRVNGLEPSPLLWPQLLHPHPVTAICCGRDATPDRCVSLMSGGILGPRTMHRVLLSVIRIVSLCSWVCGTSDPYRVQQATLAFTQICPSGPSREEEELEMKAKNSRLFCPYPSTFLNNFAFSSFLCLLHFPHFRRDGF